MIKRRGLAEAKDYLGLDADDFKNKAVLDLGSGYAMLAQDLAEQGIKNVISLDPFTVPKESFKPSETDAPKRRGDELRAAKERAVHGFGEALPFRNDTFDLIVAMYSVPYYTETPQQARVIFWEIWRTLKPGGEARIFPLVEAREENAREWDDRYKVRSKDTFRRILESEIARAGIKDSIMCSITPSGHRWGERILYTMVIRKLPRTENLPTP
ncbi:MAG: class I SAM-dependent methyltransferase [Parcubacteria group bacterium]|nr:class I SAM-dependent methyltransferase [Parcubacteria group bacterium]